MPVTPILSTQIKIRLCVFFTTSNPLEMPTMQKPGEIFEQIQRIANDMQNKVGDAIRQSPAKDMEKNVRNLMTQGFQKLDLVTREEFDLQTQVLAKTRAKLEELEAKVNALESKK